MMTRQPIFNVPRSVLGALAVLVLVHGVRGLLPHETDLMLLLALAFIPARYASAAPPLPGGELADVTSFVTYMLVHGDVIHLAINGVWMLAFGSAVAQRTGDIRFLLFSLLCGVAGAVVHLVLHFGDLAPVVGASAAISGQMAAAIRFVFSGGGAGSFGGDPRSVPLASVGQALKEPRMLIFVAVWAAVNALLGLGAVDLQGADAGIAWEAHIGGFVCGLVTFGYFDLGRRRLATPPPSDQPPGPTLH